MRDTLGLKMPSDLVSCSDDQARPRSMPDKCNDSDTTRMIYGCP